MLITKEICKSLSDKEIISRSLEDLDYFRCLYERYEVKLKRYIIKISSFSDEEAEDILQNAFINIWRSINSYDDSLKLSSFLYRIVHNETITQWRKSKSSEKVKEDFTINNIIGEEVIFEEEEEIEKESKINQIINQLPIKYKEVLVLKFIENMDYEEISNILKIPEGTVATRINRAKKAFIKITEKDNIKL